MGFLLDEYVMNHVCKTLFLGAEMCVEFRLPNNFFFSFFGRKVMPYSRQRKAAKQVMQNLGDGTTPEGEGQVRRS